MTDREAKRWPHFAQLYSDAKQRTTPLYGKGIKPGKRIPYHLRGSLAYRLKPTSDS